MFIFQRNTLWLYFCLHSKWHLFCRYSLLCLHGNAGSLLHKCHQHLSRHQRDWIWTSSFHRRLYHHLQCAGAQWWVSQVLCENIPMKFFIISRQFRFFKCWRIFKMSVRIFIENLFVMLSFRRLPRWPRFLPLLYDTVLLHQFSTVLSQLVSWPGDLFKTVVVIRLYSRYKSVCWVAGTLHLCSWETLSAILLGWRSLWSASWGTSARWCCYSSSLKWSTLSTPSPSFFISSPAPDTGSPGNFQCVCTRVCVFYVISLMVINADICISLFLFSFVEWCCHWKAESRYGQIGDELL